MRKTIVQSLSLPTEIAAESARVAKELGKPRSMLFLEAIQAHLRFYRFRKLQEKVQSRKGSRRVKDEPRADRLVHDYRRARRDTVVADDPDNHTRNVRVGLRRPHGHRRQGTYSV
jgi:hypothetical protein